MDRFKPSIIIQNRHIQTVGAMVFTKPADIKIEIEQFELDDGDFLECFWHRYSNDPTTPIVILFHGLAGSFKSHYIQQIMPKLATNNFNTVIMHFRSCSGKMNRLLRSYHSGETGDAKAFIKHIQHLYPKAKLFAVGYSLGANMLLKMLGEYKDTSPITAAVSVSAPMQLDICATQLNTGTSKLYQAYLMKDLRKFLYAKAKMHDTKKMIGLDIKDIKNIKTFWDFDEAYTAPAHGFTSAQDYYNKSSSKQYLKSIRTKTCIIQALDDPFMTPKILPHKHEYTKDTQLLICKHGGHVGFIQNLFPKPRFYLNDTIIQYFNNFTK